MGVMGAFGISLRPRIDGRERKSRCDSGAKKSERAIQLGRGVKSLTVIHLGVSDKGRSPSTKRHEWKPVNIMGRQVTRRG